MATRAATPDGKYRDWTRSKRLMVPTDVVAPWVSQLVDIHGVTGAAQLTDLPERRIYAIQNSQSPRVEYDTAEAIAMAAKKLFAFAEKVQPSGLDGWSRHGRYCGQSRWRVEGCGTFFHDHYRFGLCEECYQREYLGEGPDLPRDVRVYAEVRK